jgi:AraC-like DNA-binding protein
MSTVRQYKIAAGLKQACNVLGLSPARVLARCGLAQDVLDNESKGVTASAYFALWAALAEESGGDDLPLILGRGASCGPFQPALLAFSASPDIATGLNRLSVFKPLIAPIRLQVEENAEGLRVGFGSEGGQKLPAFYAATEIIFFLDFARTFTAHPVVPQWVTLPDLTYATPAYRDYVGAPIRAGQGVEMSFHPQDAKRPLISADTEFYQVIEKELLSRLALETDEGRFSTRVSRLLADLMPSGKVSSDIVSARLNLSKRSLQRKLKEEGTSFQAVLDTTRSSLAMTYLRDQNLSAEETSYLLAYQDPNSFYRAFHDWTGMTPAQARMAQLN